MFPEIDDEVDKILMERNPEVLDKVLSFRGKNCTPSVLVLKLHKICCALNETVGCTSTEHKSKRLIEENLQKTKDRISSWLVNWFSLPCGYCLLCRSLEISKVVKLVNKSYYGLAGTGSPLHFDVCKTLWNSAKGKHKRDLNGNEVPENKFQKVMSEDYWKIGVTTHSIDLLSEFCSNLKGAYDV